MSICTGEWLLGHGWDLRRSKPMSVAVLAWTLSSMRCLHWLADKPAIAQLVEHLTVETCSNQMVPGSIPGGRTSSFSFLPRMDLSREVGAGTFCGVGRGFCTGCGLSPPPPLPQKCEVAARPRGDPEQLLCILGKGRGRGEGGGGAFRCRRMLQKVLNVISEAAPQEYSKSDVCKNVLTRSRTWVVAATTRRPNH